MNCRAIRASLCIGTVLVLPLSVATPAGAQEHGKAGVTMGFPASIGVIVHTTDTVALRPEFSFSKNTTEGPTSADGWAVGTGVSALFYVASHDHVRTYVSPRITYSKISTTAASTFSSFTTTSTIWGGAGSFGAQYSPTPKFGLFGEVGLAYSRQTVHPGVPSFPGVSSPDVKGNQWGTRAGVGVIFYP